MEGREEAIRGSKMGEGESGKKGRGKKVEVGVGRADGEEKKCKRKKKRLYETGTNRNPKVRTGCPRTQYNDPWPTRKKNKKHKG